MLADGRWTINEVRDRIRFGLDGRGSRQAADGLLHRLLRRLSPHCLAGSWLQDRLGLKKIYADSASSYVPFLSAGPLAARSAPVLAANVAGPPSGWDLAASAWYLGRGKPVEASQIDSFRLTSGSTGLTIGTMP